MIAHVVLFEPRADLSNEARTQIFEDLASAAAVITSVRRFRVGPRVRHGMPGYEQAMRDHYSYAVVAEFDDLAGLQTYLAHPAHKTIGRHFSAAALRALAYDFELTDAAHAAHPATGA